MKGHTEKMPRPVAELHFQVAGSLRIAQVIKAILGSHNLKPQP